jgi:hypothetical protein
MTRPRDAQGRFVSAAGQAEALTAAASVIPTRAIRSVGRS